MEAVTAAVNEPVTWSLLLVVAALLLGAYELFQLRRDHNATSDAVTRTLNALAATAQLAASKPNPTPESSVDVGTSLETWGSVTYYLPGAPPTGRRVRQKSSIVLIDGTPIEDDTAMTFVRRVDGMWIPTPECADDFPPGYVCTWPELLSRFGPVTLMSLSAEERAEELLYGPLGARWGDPDTPCHYPGCALGTGHVGAHEDEDGHELGVTQLDPSLPPTRAAAGPGQLICTCGTPANHQPGCARYSRMIGLPDPDAFEPPDAEPPF